MLLRRGVPWQCNVSGNLELGAWNLEACSGLWWQQWQQQWQQQHYHRRTGPPLGTTAAGNAQLPVCVCVCVCLGLYHHRNQK